MLTLDIVRALVLASTLTHLVSRALDPAKEPRSYRPSAHREGTCIDCSRRCACSRGPDMYATYDPLPGCGEGTAIEGTMRDTGYRDGGRSVYNRVRYQDFSSNCESHIYHSTTYHHELHSPSTTTTTTTDIHHVWHRGSPPR